MIFKDSQQYNSIVMIRLIYRQWLIGLAVITSAVAITVSSGMGQTKPPSDHVYGKEAYVILVCMGNLLKQADKTNEQTDSDYKNLSTIFDQQAWIVVENSNMSPEEIERLHNDAVTTARGSTYFADCVQKAF